MEQEVKQLVIYDIKKSRLYCGDTNNYNNSLVEELRECTDDYIVYTKDEFLEEVLKNGNMPKDEFDELSIQVSKFSTIQL